MLVSLFFWDKWFGSFESEVEKPTYGLVKNIASFNPLYVAFHEWIDLFTDVFSSKISFINRLKYLIKPPGWKHDATGILSDDIRKQKKESSPNISK
jgi:hypothetical protein